MSRKRCFLGRSSLVDALVAPGVSWRRGLEGGVRLGRGVVPVTVVLLLVCAPVVFASPPSMFGGEGSAAGEIRGGYAPGNGLVVQQGSGDVLVADHGNHRVDVFSADGHFLRAFGWGVLNGESELQTCTTSCRMGLSGYGAGELYAPTSIAVNASGDVYVDESFTSTTTQKEYMPVERVQEFGPSNEFLWMVGGKVNKTKGKERETEEAKKEPVTVTPEEEDLCTAASGDACGEPMEGAGPSEFDGEYPNSPAPFPLALGVAEEVWVGDHERLQSFSPAGSFLSEIGLSGVTTVGGLAVDTDASSPSHEDYYVLRPPIAPFNASQIIHPPLTGTYTLTFEGDTTAALGYDASSPEIQAALEALPSIGAGNVSVFPREISVPGSSASVTFVGALSDKDVALMIGSGGVRIEEGVQGAAAFSGSVSRLNSSGGSLGTLDTCEACHPGALAIDPATGDVFIRDQPQDSYATGEEASTLLEFGPSGEELERFGFGQVRGYAIAFGSTAKEVYALGEEDVQVFALPKPGPLEAEGNLATSVVKSTSATVMDTLDPEGKSTEYWVEYVDQGGFEHGGFANPATKKTTALTLPADFTEHVISVTVSGLKSETTYHYRLEAKSSSGALAQTGSEESSYETLPPLSIDAEFTTEVTSTTATVGAQIDPNGNETKYRFEYLTESAFIANGDSFTGPNTPIDTPEGVLVAGEEAQSVADDLRELEPSTTYVYRVLAHNAGGEKTGAAQTFTTQGVGGPLALPDDRAWEMVSPVEKDGGAPGGIDGADPFSTLAQAAADGDAITYGSTVAFDEPVSSPPGNQYISTRDATNGRAAWSTQNINIPTNSANYAATGHPPYRAFSSDLSTALVLAGEGREELHGLPIAPLPGTEAEPGFGNVYLRHDAGTGSFQALLREENSVEAPLPLEFEVSTPDLQHVVFLAGNQGDHSLYEWSEDFSHPFQQLNFLPGDAHSTTQVNGAGNGEAVNSMHALSLNGSRVVWAAGGSGSGHALYLRENVGQEQSEFGPHKECIEPEKACTVQIDALQGGSGQSGGGEFLAAASDDSRIFFTDHQRLTPESDASHAASDQSRGDLYRFEPEAEADHRLTDLTPDSTDPNGAEVLGVMGTSEDGSYIYFVANGVLGDGAEHGAKLGQCVLQTSDTSPPAGATCNLYLYHEGEILYIATLSAEDQSFGSDIRSLTGQGAGANGDWSNESYVTARVSSDGRHLLFMSHAELTGYDNTVASGNNCGVNIVGEPLSVHCAEVYLYNAEGAVLRCVSCNPTGERPLGASGVPAATMYSNGQSSGFYQSRVLSASGGRVFFDSYDSLAPQDKNGKLDVYEWEVPGEGSCEISNETYSPASGGCVSLISSGASSENSEFVDASENGDNVFFTTGESLVKKDTGSIDIYDARVGGGEPELAPPPASCEGDACQSPPPVLIDQTPASLTFSGAGNMIAPLPPAPVVVKKKATVKCPKGKILSHGKCVKRKAKKKSKKTDRRGK